MPTTSTVYDPGPFSSIFDYDKELEWEQQRAEKQKAAQQKIMRTNAIGDALGLLVESVGGAAGATINKRPPNPFLMRASDRYNQIDDRMDAKTDKLRLMDLAQKEKDLTYNLGEKRRGEDITREDQKLKEQRTWQEGQAKASQDWAEKNREDTQVFQTERDAEGFKQQKELEGIKTKSGYAQERFRTDENIRQAKAVEDYKKTVDRSDRSKKVLKTDIPFQVPGTTQVIYLGEEEVAEMAHALIEEAKLSGKMITDPALRAIARNEMVKSESLIEVIKQNWEKAKFILPEYAKDRPADLSPQQRKYQEYKEKEAEIQGDVTLSSRQKVRQLNKLGDQYKDVAGMGQQSQGLQLNENQKGEIGNLMNAKLTKEQKRSAIYKYLVKAGYDEQGAKRFAQLAYDNL